MTVADLLCDLCGLRMAGPAVLDEANPRSAVRLLIHPGDARHKDDGGLVCRTCWSETSAWIGPEGRDGVCCVCDRAVAYDASLHVLVMTGRIGEAPVWQFCREHAVAFLNRLRTVEPKLTAASLALKADFNAR